MQNSRHWHCNGTICCKRPQSSTESSIDPSCIWCLVVCNLHSPAKVNNSINIWYIISAWHLAVVTPGHHWSQHNIRAVSCLLSTPPTFQHRTLRCSVWCAGTVFYDSGTSRSISIFFAQSSLCSADNGSHNLCFLRPHAYSGRVYGHPNHFPDIPC